MEARNFTVADKAGCAFSSYRDQSRPLQLNSQPCSPIGFQVRRLFHPKYQQNLVVPWLPQNCLLIAVIQNFNNSFSAFIAVKPFSGVTSGVWLLRQSSPEGTCLHATLIIHAPIFFELSVHHVLPPASRSPAFVAPSATTSIRKHKFTAWRKHRTTQLQRCDSICTSCRSVSTTVPHQQSGRFGSADYAKRLFNPCHTRLRHLLLAAGTVVPSSAIILWLSTVQQHPHLRPDRASYPKPFCAVRQ